MREETRRHLQFLDGWRGVSIVTVFVGHFWADEYLWSGASSFGVTLFFALSGRLMGEILFVQNTPFRTFFSRRFSRVYPGLLAFVVIVTLVFAGTSYSHRALAAVLALTFTLNYSMVYFHPIALLDHLWSLCVEEHAYVILAALAFLTRRRSYPVVPVIAGIGLLALVNGVVRVGELHQVPLIDNWRTDVSIAGLFLAAAFWVSLRSVKVGGLVSPLAFFLALGSGMSHSVLIGGLATVFSALAVATVDQACPVVRRALSGAILTRIGLWSYSLYLWQQPFYKMHRDAVAPVWVLLLGAFVCALGSFYCVEKPARRWLNLRVGVVAVA